ncbi:MAG TPA: DUF3732 domain-containing protein, partial [Acidobacteriota bacterium]|nr:DUF3732 domain-containing protein [Acidobacteriota bacterium]
MKIRSILLYSHKGHLRQLSFASGLNIITGRSSTGKSALSNIVEYCIGRSSFNVPEGVIRDKVAWYGVIYDFPGEQVLVAKPAPGVGHSRCATAMIRRGSDLPVPAVSELVTNSDDDSVVSLLSNLLGIPENRTDVPLEHSRASYSTNIKHTLFYVFQKQNLVANKDQLFYRQNEDYMPQAIRDTLPILLGAADDDRFGLDSKLRAARRELKLQEKLIFEAAEFARQISSRGIGLLSEARQVGILPSGANPSSTEEVLNLLKVAMEWKPATIPDEDPGRISGLEEELSSLRADRRALTQRLEAANLFCEKANGFSREATEQKDRLESINALPRNTDTGEW